MRSWVDMGQEKNKKKKKKKKKRRKRRRRRRRRRRRAVTKVIKRLAGTVLPHSAHSAL